MFLATTIARAGQTFNDLLAMIRFSHTIFALPFALLALAMAWRLETADDLASRFRWWELLGVLLCMVFARTAAMSFNRLADSRIDAANPRTSDRHLPTGRLSARTVGLFTALAGVGFVASTALFLPRNPIPLYASIPVLLFLCGYSYSKRFSMFCHFWLGAALMLAPLAAWVVVRAQLDPPVLLLGIAVMFWVAGFDIIYACQDEAFDRREKLHSIPARFGVARALRIAAGCHFVTAIVLPLIPLMYPPFGSIFYLACAAIAGLLLYEHSIVRPDDLSRVGRAFFHVNAIISMGLLAVGAVDLIV